MFVININTIIAVAMQIRASVRDMDANCSKSVPTGLNHSNKG